MKQVEAALLQRIADNSAEVQEILKKILVDINKLRSHQTMEIDRYDQILNVEKAAEKKAWNEANACRMKADKLRELWEELGEIDGPFKEAVDNEVDILCNKFDIFKRLAESHCKNHAVFYALKDKAKIRREHYNSLRYDVEHDIEAYGKIEESTATGYSRLDFNDLDEALNQESEESNDNA